MTGNTVCDILSAPYDDAVRLTSEVWEAATRDGVSFDPTDEVFPEDRPLRRLGEFQVYEGASEGRIVIVAEDPTTASGLRGVAITE